MKLHTIRETASQLTDVLISRVAAGVPAEVSGELEQVDLNYLLTKGNPYAMLVRVQGESMSSEISDGDWVMIDRNRQPEPNNIVLAHIAGGFTIKRWKTTDGRGKGGLYLVPANEVYKPRHITEHDAFEILGVVTHIIKEA